MEYLTWDFKAIGVLIDTTPMLDDCLNAKARDGWEFKSLSPVQIDNGILWAILIFERTYVSNG